MDGSHRRPLGYYRVEQWHPGLPSTFKRAYAMKDAREYFAETTEAFFGRNTTYPFTRDELTKHDPAMAALLQRLWQASAPPPAPLPAPEFPTASAPFNSRCFYRLTTQWQGDGMSLDILFDGKANNTPILASVTAGRTPTPRRLRTPASGHK